MKAKLCDDWTCFFVFPNLAEAMCPFNRYFIDFFFHVKVSFQKGVLQSFSRSTGFSSLFGDIIENKIIPSAMAFELYNTTACVNLFGSFCVSGKPSSSHVTRARVMSLELESCHSSSSHVTRARVMSLELECLLIKGIILCFWETELESCHSSLSTYSSSDSNRTQNIELGYDKVDLLSAIELGSENHTRARQNIELGVCGIHTLFSGGRRGYPYSSSIKTNRARNGWLKGN